MAVTVQSIGVVVPGHITRKRDGDDTVLTLDGKQARSLYESLGTVVGMFEGPDPEPLV